MGEASISDGTALGYEPPQNTQFSVFLDNRVGKLLELLDVFRGQALQVVALSIVDSADCAIVRLITSRAALARRLLERNRYPFGETAILVVELTGGQDLSLLCTCLLHAELSIRYAYPLMVRPHGSAAIALHTDDQTLAGQILRRKMFTLLGENDLGDNATPADSGGPEPTN